MANAPPPNYTQSPNVYFDTWLKEIDSLAELKVVNVIMRHTFGWHKHNVTLGTSELVDLTGLSRVSVCDGVKRALEHGYIVRKTDGPRGLASFRIAVEMTGKDSLPDEAVTGKESLPDTGKGSIPYTGKDSLHAYKDKEKEKESRKKADDPRGYPFDHFAVAEYETHFQTDLAIFQAETIATTVDDSPESRAVWSDVLRTFKGNGYQARYAGNALDRYVKDRREISAGKKSSPLNSAQPRTITLREQFEKGAIR
jgi:hypothetical protein